jgi:hypothetical protein
MQRNLHGEVNGFAEFTDVEEGYTDFQNITLTSLYHKICVIFFACLKTGVILFQMRLPVKTEDHRKVLRLQRLQFPV